MKGRLGSYIQICGGQRSRRPLWKWPCSTRYHWGGVPAAFDTSSKLCPLWPLTDRSVGRDLVGLKGLKVRAALLTAGGRRLSSDVPFTDRWCVLFYLIRRTRRLCCFHCVAEIKRPFITRDEPKHLCVPDSKARKRSVCLCVTVCVCVCLCVFVCDWHISC